MIAVGRRRTQRRIKKWIRGDFGKRFAWRIRASAFVAVNGTDRALGTGVTSSLAGSGFGMELQPIATSTNLIYHGGVPPVVQGLAHAEGAQ